MTPMVKAFVTDICAEATNIGMQVMGGHGYIRESGMEQLVRDARVAQLYAGANGIQALDLVAHKLPARDGRAFDLFMRSVDKSLLDQPYNAALGSLTEAVRRGIESLRIATRLLLQEMPSDAHLAGSAGYTYLQLFGYVCVGIVWTHIATAQFYVQHLLPSVERCLASIRAGSDAMMRLHARRLHFVHRPSYGALGPLARVRERTLSSVGTRTRMILGSSKDATGPQTSTCCHDLFGGRLGVSDLALHTPPLIHRALKRFARELHCARCEAPLRMGSSGTRAPGRAVAPWADVTLQ